MEQYFTADYQWLWALGLGLALLFPVRQVIWVMSVRRAIRKLGDIDDGVREALKKRATITALLLCFVFSFFYTAQLFKS